MSTSARSQGDSKDYSETNAASTQRRFAYCALKEGVVSRLRAGREITPVELLIPQVCRKIQEDLLLSPDAAEWAVKSWAAALGLLPTLPTKVARFEPSQHAKDLDEQILFYIDRLALNPSDAEAYYNRGYAYDEKEQYDRAIEDYTKAMSLRPDYAEAYCNRGISYRKNGQYDRAIEDYTKAISLRPDYAAAYYNRGYAYREKGRNKEAERDFKKSTELKTVM